MKTKEQRFIFNKEEVQDYVQLLGDTNPIYVSEVRAKQLGYKTIPIPPLLPMTVYASFEIPWTMQSPVILRKQQCEIHEKLFIDEVYTGFISLTDVRVRRGRTFSKENLFLYDKKGILCFHGMSELISGGLL